MDDDDRALQGLVDATATIAKATRRRLARALPEARDADRAALMAGLSFEDWVIDSCDDCREPEHR